jgi:NADH-quinone oxidoreductase subunit A
MSGQLIEYVPLIVGIVVAMGTALGMLVLNALLGPKRGNPSKQQPFECGNTAAGPARNRFHVKYYLVALVFLVFDVEAVFLLPWAVEYRRLLDSPLLGGFVLLEALLFVAVLAVGLLYVWKRDALRLD